MWSRACAQYSTSYGRAPSLRCRPSWPPSDPWPEAPALTLLRRARPLVLFLDEVDATGQPFQETVLLRVLEVTRGQPWLVNVIAHEIIGKIGVTPSTLITSRL